MRAMNNALLGLMVFVGAQSATAKTDSAETKSFVCPERISFEFNAVGWESIAAVDSHVKARGIQANYMFCELNHGVVGVVRLPVPDGFTCRVSGEKQFECEKSPIRFTTFKLEPLNDAGPNGCFGKSTFFVKTDPPTPGLKILAWHSGIQEEVYHTDKNGEINGEYEIAHEFDPNAPTVAQSDQCIRSENPAQQICRYATKPLSCGESSVER